MNLKKTAISDLIEIQPKVFGDSRGYFFEAYNKNNLKELGISTEFVQDNQSYSAKNVLRGLHFQKPPFAQAKLVRVITGKVLDVVVDLRKDSPSFGHHYKCVLDSEKNNMLFIPEGFAHGFLTLEDSIFFYKCNQFYHKDSESGILWNDPTLNINWGVENPVVSEKDQQLLPFETIKNSL